MTKAASALDVVTKLLSGRDKTRAQLRAALERKGFGVEEIEAALRRVVELGYVDEARVARRKAGDLLGEGWCGEALTARLGALGLDAQTIDSAVAEARAELGWNESAAAQALISKRRLEGVKAARFLASRGFSEDTVARLVPA